MTSPLISPDALRLCLHQVRLLDARPGPAAYAAGHLPGAHHADLERHLSTASAEGFDPVPGGRHPLPSSEAFAQQVGRWGIHPETRVVVYDDQAGANAAARLWWMLRSLGHEWVQVLDGGLKGALAAGIPLEATPPREETLPAYLIPAVLGATQEIDQVERLAQSPSWKVLDVRSGERYRGETEPLDPVAGHIPGALNLPFTENLRDGRYKSPEELRSLYLAFLDGTPPERLVVHCGSGVTACHTLLALELAGLRGASLYVGSWSQWCRSGKPLERSVS